MDRREIKAICAQVLSDRKRQKQPVEAPRPLRFTNGRFVRRVEDLDAASPRQLDVVGRAGVGAQLGPEVLITNQDREDEQSLYGLEV